ncbi:hypothetical protein WME97_19350 [Sorangium sp. So ce367]|uniref:hypothetical protein n=1 Tax=Sorangium sp. So ce367 TaxID=3133305 RepID=UPI003F61C11D
MGQPDLFAKRTFAEETERLTGGAITWQDPPEIRLEKVQCDGLLLIHRPAATAWSRSGTGCCGSQRTSSPCVTS